MALVGDDLYVANTDALVRFPYAAGSRPRLPTPARRSPTCRPDRSIITGPRTWSRARDGQRLYVTVGSNSNIGENGMDAEAERAAIWESIRRTGQHRFSRPGCATRSASTWIRRPARSGLCQRARRARQRPGARLSDLGAGRRLLRLALQLLRRTCRTAREPRASGSRRQGRGSRTTLSARMPRRSGLAFSDGAVSRPRFRDGAFIGQHGSWNRTAQRLQGDLRAVRRAGARPAPRWRSSPGFSTRRQALGRPVGVAIDRPGRCWLPTTSATRCGA